MNHERAYIADIRNIGVQLQSIHKGASLFQVCVFESESHNGARSLRQVFLGSLVPGRGRQTGPDHLIDQRMLLQPVCDLGRVLDMAFDAQGKSLQTDTNVEGVGWRDRRPGVAQKRNSRLENIGKVRTKSGVFAQVTGIN